MRMIRVYATLEEMFPQGFNLTSVQSAVNQLAQSKETLDSKFGKVLNILSDEYYDWYIGYVDKFKTPGIPVVISEADKNIIEKKFIREIMVKYALTSDKYLKLLQIYEDSQSRLMDKLENKTIAGGEHRVNDTPQNAGTGHQNFTDDDHTSLWESTDNTTTVTNDPMTIMSRLDEIQNKYMNVLKAWCREFSSLFITPTDEFDIEGEQ